MSATFNQCLACTHLLSGDDDGPPTCEAFPDGIPSELWGDSELNDAAAQVGHDEAFPGDNGVQFEMEPSMRAELSEAAAAFFRGAARPGKDAGEDEVEDVDPGEAEP